MGSHKDFATSTVLTAPSPATSGTSLVVQSAHGARFDSVNLPFYCTAHPEGQLPTLDNAELVKVTAVSTDTFTIERAQGDTTAKTIEAGWRISNVILAQDLRNTTMVRNETPGGSLNGSNTAFTTASVYADGSLKVYLNGVRQRSGASNDYTETSSGFTMNTAPESDDVLLVDYEITDLTWTFGATDLVTNETPSGLVNSSNTAYTTGSSYIAGTLEVYINGVSQKRGTDFTETTPGDGDFTMTTAPTSGDDIWCNYQHVLSTGGNAAALSGSSLSQVQDKDNHTINTAFKAYRTSSQTIPNTTYTTVAYNNEYYDYGSNYSTSTGRFTAPVKGIYNFIASAGIDSLGDDDLFIIGFLAHGTLFRPHWRNHRDGGTGRLNGVVSADFELEAGETVEVQIYHNFGSARNAVSAETYATFSGRLVGKT